MTTFDPHLGFPSAHAIVPPAPAPAFRKGAKWTGRVSSALITL